MDLITKCHMQEILAKRTSHRQMCDLPLDRMISARSGITIHVSIPSPEMGPFTSQHNNYWSARGPKNLLTYMATYPHAQCGCSEDMDCVAYEYLCHKKNSVRLHCISNVLTGKLNQQSEYLKHKIILFIVHSKPKHIVTCLKH
ncbi:hypothetical protein AVEN_212720-1 [Araneus ventricosus]|uniref:Uncharacterized protein n=1 Tax=Araneus ventricosus TaxID=182803 RepID=A0A4Y2JI22_ARAVE|nr:hypothetical protein AVEN_212720-1 [Araneus ventricosus]